LETRSDHAPANTERTCSANFLRFCVDTGGTTMPRRVRWNGRSLSNDLRTIFLSSAIIFWRHFIESASEGGDDLTLIFRQLFYRYVTRLTNAETYVRKFSPRRRPHVTQIRDCGLVAQMALGRRSCRRLALT